jgi:nucleoside-diphosphate-sugar epimerase
MRILFIGGTRMTGPFAVRDLIQAGHEVWLLHRSHSEVPLLDGATQIKADKADLPAMRRQLELLHLDVAVQMMAFTESDAAAFAQTMAGIVPRAVVISSIDVYRAYGRLHRTEPGEPDPVPLSEDAPLREKLSIHGQAYDKTAVERIAQSDPNLPCTILRYPAVYGPGDHLGRLQAWVRRIEDARPFILIGKGQSTWRFTHGYVENVSQALVLAITQNEASGRIYNVGEESPPPWARWAGAVGKAMQWRGQVKIIPDDRLPRHLADNLDFRQDWVVDTSRIRRELGYRERIPLDECMRRASAWERSVLGTRDPSGFDYAAEDRVVAELH